MKVYFSLNTLFVQHPVGGWGGGVLFSDLLQTVHDRYFVAYASGFIWRCNHREE